MTDPTPDPVVGSYTIGPNAEPWRRTYEVAAWHTEVQLTPGTYDIVLTKGTIGRRELRARIPGTIVSSYTPSLFGGVAYGTQPQGTEHKDVGRPDEAVMRLGGYVGADPQAKRYTKHGLVLLDDERLFIRRTYRPHVTNVGRYGHLDVYEAGSVWSAKSDSADGGIVDTRLYNLHTFVEILRPY